jgi:hypothetical protein
VARIHRPRDGSLRGRVSASASSSPDDQNLAKHRGEASRQLTPLRSHAGPARSRKRGQPQLPLTLPSRSVGSGDEEMRSTPARSAASGYQREVRVSVTEVVYVIERGECRRALPGFADAHKLVACVRRVPQGATASLAAPRSHSGGGDDCAAFGGHQSDERDRLRVLVDRADRRQLVLPESLEASRPPFSSASGDIPTHWPRRPLMFHAMIRGGVGRAWAGR